MNFRELYDLMRNLTPKERRDVLEYTRLRYRLLKEEQAESPAAKKNAAP